MKRKTVEMIALGLFALTLALSTTRHAQAQDSKNLYPNMAPLDDYLMDRNAEIALARTAAPPSISKDATVMVLGRDGYETAIEGTNGFVCMVERSWMAAFDWSEFWNPKVRAADCLNPQAARSIFPIVLLRSRMVMAGRSKAEILSAIKVAFENRQLPDLESGAMAYMMSKSAYLTDEDDHKLSHLMFFTAVMDAKDWGSGAAGSPVKSAPYWFFSSKDLSQMKGLPPIRVFIVMAPDWSDETPADGHADGHAH